MRYVLAFVLLLTAVPAAAGDLIARRGNDSVRLTDKPCTDAQVLAHIDPRIVGRFQAATAVFQGQHYQACWRRMNGGAHLVYEDGDQGVVPGSDLKPALGV